MIRYLERLYERWHNAVLLFIYHILDSYLVRERVKTMIVRTLMFVIVISTSIIFYFTLTRWIPGSKKILEFTANHQSADDTQTPPPGQVQLEPAQPIPVEKDMTY
jgi:hypothetical protein